MIISPSVIAASCSAPHRPFPNDPSIPRRWNGPVGRKLRNFCNFTPLEYPSSIGCTVLVDKLWSCGYGYRMCPPCCVNVGANFQKGDDAQSGQFEPIAVYTFPGIEKDRNIEWKGQGHFGNGRIMIGQEVVPRTELLGQGTKLVPAGQIVRVGSMEIRFTDC
jgi:hypothetical protein